MSRDSDYRFLIAVCFLVIAPCMTGALNCTQCTTLEKNCRDQTYIKPCNQNQTHCVEYHFKNTQKETIVIWWKCGIFTDTTQGCQMVPWHEDELQAGSVISDLNIGKDTKQVELCVRGCDEDGCDTSSASYHGYHWIAIICMIMLYFNL